MAIQLSEHGKGLIHGAYAQTIPASAAPARAPSGALHAKVISRKGPEMSGFREHGTNECDRFVEDLLDYMTLEEKVGQLAIVTAPDDVSDLAATRSKDQFFDRLRRGRISAVVGLVDHHRSDALQRIAVEETRLGIPLLIAAPTTHGLNTAMPTALAAMASWDSIAVEHSERAVAVEACAAGINWALDPAVHLSPAGQSPLAPTSSGSDPFLAAQIAAARVRGLQGRELAASDSLLACIDIDASAARAREGGTARTMFENIAYGTDVASAVNVGGPTNPGHTEHDAYREQSGFDGILLAEWAAIAEAATGSQQPDGFANIPVDAVMAAISSSRIARSRLDDAVRRVIAAKFKLGLFREPFRKAPRLTQSVRANHRESALELACKSIIMLRNEGAILPLPTTAQDLLIVGSAAADRSLPLAGHSGQAMSVIDGLEHLGIHFKYAPGLALRSGSGGGAHHGLIPADRMAIGMASEAARRAGTVVVVLGEGRADTRFDMLGDAQTQMLHALHNANPRMIAVTLGTTPLDIDPSGIAPGCMLHAGGLGTMSGLAIASILSGAASPSGKLPYPIHKNSRRSVYSFGHGLGLGNMSVAAPSFSLLADRIEAVVDVRNLGDHAGHETVQLYIRHSDGSSGAYQPPLLKGFAKIFLQPGETRRVMFVLGAAEMGQFAADGRFSVERGWVDVRLGTSMATARGTEINLPASVAAAMTGGGNPFSTARRSA